MSSVWCLVLSCRQVRYVQPNRLMDPSRTGLGCPGCLGPPGGGGNIISGVLLHSVSNSNCPLPATLKLWGYHAPPSL